MTNLTIKYIEGKTPEETQVLRTYYRYCPAFYGYKEDTVVLTKKITAKGYINHICDIIDHEYQHAILSKLEGKEACIKLDNLIREMLEWIP